MRTLFGIAALVSLTATAQVRWVSDDFFLGRTTDISNARVPVTDCREHIEKIMCLVEEGPAGTPRPCVEGGAAYAPVFQELYDAYPPALQKMFCSLRTIFVEKTFEGTAYAGLYTDQDGKKFAQMGIRRSVLDERLDLHTWATWKEQLSFGGHKDKYEPKAGLPVVSAGAEAQVNDFLYFVIAHEFGHIFDFANGLNKFASEECYEKWLEEGKTECEYAPETWGTLSWKTSHAPLPEFEFTHRKDLCFYWCAKTIPREEIPVVYRGLFGQSNFISTYASRHAWDDLAETLGYYLFRQHASGRYLVDTTKGHVHDALAHLDSERMRPKVDYLRRFIESDTIVYP